VLGNLTPSLSSLRGPADPRFTIVGPTGRHKKGGGGGGKAKGVRMWRDCRRGSGLSPRHGWASHGWNYHLHSIIMLRIMYVYMLNQLFKEYNSFLISRETERSSRR